MLPYIFDYSPTHFAKNVLRWPSFIKLADSSFNNPGAIDMFIGIEMLYKLRKGKIEMGIGKPVLQESAFGCVVVGPVSVNNFK